MCSISCDVMCGLRRVGYVLCRVIFVCAPYHVTSCVGYVMSRVIFICAPYPVTACVGYVMWVTS